MKHDDSRELHARIAETIAGGETSYARSLGSHPIVIDRSEGAHLLDVDGNLYVDYCGGYGVNLFGHNPAFVVDAVTSAISSMGPHFAFPHRLYGEVGERVASLVPGIEQMRFTNSGTEATMAAMRLARGFTKRDLIVKFEGAYHGWADVHYLGLSAPADGGTPLHRSPDSSGIPEISAQSVLVCEYNDRAGIDEVFETMGDRIAAVLVEPVLGSGALLGPAPGFLEHLRARTQEHGSLLVFDDVMMGFRLGPGGSAEYFGVTPDITTLGKILGGGFALGLFGGLSEVMSVVARGDVVHGGTYSGSPTVLAAARAVLDRITEDGTTLYKELAERTERLASGIESAMAGARLEGQVRRVASMLQPLFGGASSEASTYRDIVTLQDEDLHERFCSGLVERGVFVHRYPLGRWFLSTAHDDMVIDETLADVAAVLDGLV